MPRIKLPEVQFETGIIIKRKLPGYCGGQIKLRHDILIIGRLDNGTPFLLKYVEGLTSWWCPDTLGDSLRKKILGRLREEVRYAETPPYITIHSVEVLDETDTNRGSAAASVIETEFFDKIWRSDYLNDRDEDYVALSVPFAEKNLVKALGAGWDSISKVWRVKIREDMTPFSRWMAVP